MNPNDTPTSSASEGGARGTASTPSGRSRLPSARASAVLATVMLGAGIAVGAAIGPAAEASLAGGSGIAQKLPALIAAAVARNHSQPAPQATAATTAPPAIAPQATPAATPASTTTTSAPAPATTPTTPAEGESNNTSTAPTKSTAGGTSKLPVITSVWLIELSGVSFAEAIAAPTTAPYITGQLIPKGTLLSSWSALSGSAFANDAALAEHKASVGAAPPLLHSIVQPPCPEGAAGTTCAAGTPGALTAADEFLKATLATVTATTTYSEHGLVVVTFATVSDPAASELPAGASNATLTSQPPAGVVLLSPFAKAGVRPATTFNPTSPKQSLEKLLR